MGGVSPSIRRALLFHLLCSFLSFDLFFSSPCACPFRHPPFRPIYLFLHFLPSSSSTGPPLTFPCVLQTQPSDDAVSSTPIRRSNSDKNTDPIGPGRFAHRRVACNVLLDSTRQPSLTITAYSHILALLSQRGPTLRLRLRLLPCSRQFYILVTVFLRVLPR